MESKKFVWATKLGEKGQMVLPKEAREVFGFNVGDTVILLGDTERGIAIAKKEDCQLFAEMFFKSIEGADNDKNK